MSLITFQRVITSVGFPNDTYDLFEFDPDTDTTTITTGLTAPTGTVGDFQPPVGTFIFGQCVDGNRIVYTTYLVDYDPYVSALHYLTKTTEVDSLSCCDLSSTLFDRIKTNNTSLLTPNGTISVSAPTLIIADYEASIDGGDNWVGSVGSSITFTGLSAGSYTVLVREISGVCHVSFTIALADNITYPPLIVSPSPAVDTKLYSPVFYPIEVGYRIDNNTATVKNDTGGTYLEADTADAREYLATLPIIKIFDNEDYAGTYKINSVDDDLTPTKFYFSGVYTSDQVISFVPFERQVFYLYAEKDTFNNFQKIGNISVYPNDVGDYVMRIEWFLQAVFKVNPPVNAGDELALLRKYYVVPKDFDMETSPVIYNAVYSAIPDLTPFLSDLIPLGPAPINFINEQTLKGLPVIFSYIDTTTQRIVNITSSQQTHVVSTSPNVYIPGLPFNAYDVTWINPDGVISSLVVDPALPSWISIEASASDTVKLTIDTNLASGTGDYDGEDYDADDYLEGQPNAIVGCYEYEFSDGVTPLFTLQICIYPIQKSHALKCDGLNIAWINQQGGWSSYVFSGRKTYGKDIGSVQTYKSGDELKRSSVEDIYDTVEINLTNLAIKDLIFISSLRQSVQAYLWSDDTLQWSIPIILDNKSFTTYSTPFKQIEVSDKLTFKYANEIRMQTQ